jgi:hypothetical protein
MGLCGRRHAPAALHPGKRPGTHVIGSWVGPPWSVWTGAEILSAPGLYPRIVQPVAGRCTDYAIRAHQARAVKTH